MPARFNDVTSWDKGDNIVVKIPFTGVPRPTARWTLNGEEIKPSKHVSIELKERHAILTIDSANKCNSGVYNLTLENELGSDTVKFELDVNDAPNKPSGVRVEGHLDSGVMLSWTAPVSDTGKKGYISEYHIEKKELPSGNWIRCATSRFSNVQLDSLQNGKEYQFRVIAENLHGRSEPSEEIGPIKIGEDFIKAKKNNMDQSGRYRGEYDGPEIDNYDKFCKFCLNELEICCCFIGVK